VHTDLLISSYSILYIPGTGAGIAQSVYRLATGWTTEGSEFESR
jgi:hypothetical protein